MYFISVNEAKSRVGRKFNSSCGGGNTSFMGLFWSFQHDQCRRIYEMKDINFSVTFRHSSGLSFQPFDEFGYWLRILGKLNFQWISSSRFLILLISLVVLVFSFFFYVKCNQKVAANLLECFKCYIWKLPFCVHNSNIIFFYSGNVALWLKICLIFLHTKKPQKRAWKH